MFITVMTKGRHHRESVVSACRSMQKSIRRCVAALPSSSTFWYAPSATNHFGRMPESTRRSASRLQRLPEQTRNGSYRARVKGHQAKATGRHNPRETPQVHSLKLTTVEASSPPPPSMIKST
jgi:hypothetical protein